MLERLMKWEATATRLEALADQLQVNPLLDHWTKSVETAVKDFQVHVQSTTGQVLDTFVKEMDTQKSLAQVDLDKQLQERVQFVESKMQQNIGLQIDFLEAKRQSCLVELDSTRQESLRQLGRWVAKFSKRLVWISLSQPWRRWCLP
jgi:hypothetical protein